MFNPEGNSTTHAANLPVPLPILEPAPFLLSGKWGKMLNQTLRDVLSARRDAFFKKSLIRKMCLLFNLKGCKIWRP
jgi:hypothetical protein